MSNSSRNGPRGLAELIGAGGPLAGLAKAASSRLDLADCVRQQVPVALRTAITACNLRPDGTLVVTTAGADWASRLRFEADAILAGCQRTWPAATRVQLRVGAR